jgi:DNA-binding SARP family transcriptional activator
MGTPILQIRLFGGLDLRYDGRQIAPPESMRAGSLLAYLLLNRHAPQLREQIAFLLWPDSIESQARTNLRHVLHHLRRAMPDADRFIAITPQTLQWRPDGDYWLDVATFEALIASVNTTRDERVRLDALRDAARLYTGELLAGWYDEWVLTIRERLQQQYLRVLERLVIGLEACGETAEAVEHAEQLLRHDPLNEESYRLLMRLYAARGDRARALRLYHVCVTTLQRELDVEPSAETRAAYEALLPATFEPATTQLVTGAGAPFVGRDAERRNLAGCWYAAEQGNAQCVVLIGESGVGKTRLTEELRTWCAHRGAAVATARSYAAEGALAYAPVVGWLRSEPIAQRRHALSLPVLADLTRLLPEIVSETRDLPATTQLSEAEQRQRLFDAMVSAITAVEEPLLLVADDIHWSDRETIQFLHYLIRTRPDARLMILATARQEEMDANHPIRDLAVGLSALERYSEVEVGRFDAAGTATLAEQLAGRSLNHDEASQLYRETEGNPLFIVEAIRAGWTGTRDWITPRVQAVIQSRFAKLSDAAGEIVGIAATIGREFTVDVLTQASGRDDETMIGALDELWRRRIIREQGVDGYDFTHDKLREVAYGSLSPARRGHTHLRVAQALERVYSHDPGPISGQLAAHYEQAGAADNAARCTFELPKPHSTSTRTAKPSDCCNVGSI